MTYPVGVTFLLIHPDGTILMQLRDDGGAAPIRYPHMWNFPGGAREGNETPRAADIREIQEEFGIAVPIEKLDLLCTYEHDATEEYVYAYHLPEVLSLTLHEGQAMEWMSFEKIKTLPLAFHREIIFPYIETYLQKTITS